LKNTEHRVQHHLESEKDSRDVAPESNFADQLMKLAGYSKISAVSYAIHVPEGIYGKTVYSVKEFSYKLYIPAFIQGKRILGLVDSGSDITIMQFSTYQRLCNKNGKFVKSDIDSVESYSNHHIKIRGMVHLRLKLSPDHPGINLIVYLIDDIVGPCILLGNDLSKQDLGSISYMGSVAEPVPEIIFNFPLRTKCCV